MNNANKLIMENKIRVSNAGYEYDISSMVWHVNQGCNIHLHEAIKYLDKNIVEGYISTLSFFSEQYSSSYASHINRLFIRMLNYKHTYLIDESIILNYKASLQKHQLRDFIKIKSFLMKWHLLNHPGISDEVISLLRSIKIKKFGVGEVVKMHDPNKGAFNMEEMLLIGKAVETAYVNGKLLKTTYAMLKLLMETGRRISQLLLLKNKNLIHRDDRYYLSIPRLKQKGAKNHSSRIIEIEKDLWWLLSEISIMNTGFIIKNYKNTVSREQVENIPIFLSKSKLKDVPINELMDYLNRNLLHISRSSMGIILSRLSTRMNILSPRTNLFMNITSVRFRYTFATMLAKENSNLENIAFLMDHSGTENVGYYIENTADNVLNIDTAMTKYLNQIANIFLGKENYTGYTLLNSFTMDLSHNKTSKQAFSCEECIHFNKWR